MTIEVRQLSDNEKILEGVIPAEKMLAAYNEKLAELSNRVKIKGFRANKVPRHLIESYYGSDLLLDIAKALIEETLSKAVEEEGIDPIEQFKIDFDSIKIEKGKPLTFSTTFQEFPVFDFSTLNEITIKKPVAAIEVKHINDEIEKVRQENAELKPVDRPVEKGDVVLIDITFKKTDGTVIPEVSLKQKEIRLLDSAGFIPGLLEQLIGAKKNTPFHFTLSIPKDYPIKAIADQAVICDVFIHDIKSHHLKALDKDFIQALGIEEGTIGAFRESIRTSLEELSDQQAKIKIKDTLFKQLINHYQIQAPASLLNPLIEQKRKEAEAQAKQTPSQGPIDEQLLHSAAYHQVCTFLLLRSFCKQHDIKADTQQIEAYCRELARNAQSAGGAQASFLQNFYTSQSFKDNVKAQFIEQEALNRLLEQVTLELETVPFETIMEKA